MPRIEQCEGVVVRIQPYSESSLITTWLTDQQGIIQLLIRGIRKPKQKNFDPVDLLNQSQLTYAANTRSYLHTAQEIKLLASRRLIATNYSKLLTCTYFFEVISMLVERDTPLQEIYQLYLKALDYLENHESGTRLIERFERRLFTSLGLEHETLSILQARQQHYPKPPKSGSSLFKELKD